jgi:hypothetical protein
LDDDSNGRRDSSKTGAPIRKKAGTPFSIPAFAKVNFRRNYFFAFAFAFTGAFFAGAFFFAAIKEPPLGWLDTNGLWLPFQVPPLPLITCDNYRF